VDIVQSHSLPAPAEVVYNTMTDPYRTARWMPPGVNAWWAGRHEFCVRVGPEVRAYAVSTEPERLGLTWSGEGGGSDLRGSVRVVDLPAGGSTLEIHLWSPSADWSDAWLGMLDDALRRLDSEVDDNFTAG
jgi:uncharacterized protein YndB with AHSA1/START domain